MICICVAFNYFIKKILKLCMYDFQSYFLITKRKKNWKLFRKKKNVSKDYPAWPFSYVLGIILMDYIITVNISLHF